MRRVADVPTRKEYPSENELGIPGLGEATGLREASRPPRCKRREPPFGGSVGDGRAGPATSTRHGWKQLPLIIEAPLGHVWTAPLRQVLNRRDDDCGRDAVMCLACWCSHSS